MGQSSPEGLALYHYVGCGYCAIVRNAIDRLGVSVELRDIQLESAHARVLFDATSRLTVPCLRIEASEEDDRWLHESIDIVRYLEDQFSS